MRDQIIREIPLIERYSRHNEADDMRFGSYVKDRLNLSNVELDSVVRDTTDEVWKQIDCTTCANCCKTLQIEVNIGDIRRLAARLGMTPPQFSRKYVLTGEDGSKYFASMPCPFLGSDNLCTVYEDRPESCREYPFLHNGSFRQKTLLMIESTAVCPIVFNVWDSLKDRLKFRRKRR